MTQLLSFVYKSDASDETDENTLVNILSSSREYNKKAGITGMLLYAHKKYFQVLEGDPAEVKKLFNERISKDPRHLNIEILEENTVEERSFGEWAMGFYMQDGSNAEEFAILNAPPRNALNFMLKIKEHMARNKVDMPL